ncbi:MAG: YbaB/EbfC family nucleoid-associated protein [Pseudonocardiaceae bacterium]
MDPHEWLRQYHAQGDDMVQRSREFGEQLREVSETVSSRDGAVTVTVSPSGALQDLQFSPRVGEMSHVQLSALVMETVRGAQARVAHKVVELVEPLAGGGEAMTFLRGELPPLPDQNEDRRDGDDDGYFGRGVSR